MLGPLGHHQRGEKQRNSGRRTCLEESEKKVKRENGASLVLGGAGVDDEVTAGRTTNVEKMY